MILQDEEILITLKNLVFTSYKTQDPHFRLDEEAITGWFDGVSMRRDDSPRPVQWGSFEVPGYLGSRMISITGIAIARNARELQSMRDVFMGTLVKGEFSRLMVNTTSAGSRFADVGLEGAPSWIPQTDLFASWKLDLFAPDPRIYGEVNQWMYRGSTVEGGLTYPLKYPLSYNVYDAGASPTIVNIGNTDAWPTIIAEGNMPDGFSVTNGGGDWVIYDGPVSFTAPVTINFETGVASSRGQDRSNNLRSREWFPISPGSGLKPKFSYPNPGLGQEGWLKFEVKDTWI